MKFGDLKIKILTVLTESFTKDDKSNVKSILKKIKSNSDFKELYLLYENIENKYFDDKEVAKFYVDELSSLLKNKNIPDQKSKFGKFLNETAKDFQNVEISENQVYSLLDTLCENDSLLNIDRKVLAKKELVKYLTTQKQAPDTVTGTFTENEQLLHTVLTNNFNVLYNHTLNEEQKDELKNILSIPDEDLKTQITDLKESILGQVKTILEDTTTDNELKDKLTQVKEEVYTMSNSKYNYYKLTQLKNGLS